MATSSLQIVQIVRSALIVYVISGLVTTWRAADSVRLLPNDPQQFEFLAIYEDQVDLQILASGAFVNPIKFMIGDKIGAGLDRGASTATIMREMFLGKKRVTYVLCALLFLCLPLVPSLLGTWFVRSQSKMQK